MSQQRPLRFGMVGCGNQGYTLAAAVTRIPGLCLAACADPDRAAASRVAALAPDASPRFDLCSLLDLILFPSRMLRPFRTMAADHPRGDAFRQCKFDLRVNWI